MKKLKIKEFITEDNNRIANEILFEVLDHKQKILLISAMKTGKTTFVMKYLSNILLNSNIQLIFVTPIKSLMNDIKSKYKIIPCHGGITEINLNDNIPVLTTPESMHKVIATCEEAAKDYFIVYDEIHMVITNATFREALRNPFEYYKNELCVGFLGMTATPDPLRNVKFDNTFELQVENKFIQADKTVIVKNFINNPDNMLNFIKNIGEQYKNKQIIARINNSEYIELLKPKLENVSGWHRGNNKVKETESYIEDMTMFENIPNGADISDKHYILCTSLMDVGIELNLKEKPIVIDFLDNSNIVDDIQFVGRFRQGIETLYFVGNLNKEEEKINTKPISQRLEFNKNLETTNNLIIAANAAKENFKSDLDVIGVKTLKDGNGQRYFELDKYALMQQAFKKYINFYLQTDVYFKKFLESHKTFNTGEIEVVPYEDYGIKKSNELKKEKDELQKTILESQIEFIATIKALNEEDEIIKLILNEDLVLTANEWKIQKYEDICTTWKQKPLEKLKKRYKQVSERLGDIPKTQIEILEISSTATTIKNLKNEINIIHYNKIFNENKDLKPPKENTKMLMLFAIRNCILKIKGKERDVYLSKKFKKELLEEVQKEKKLSKTSAKELDNFLKLIYNISINNKTEKIKSIKLNL